MFRTFLLLLRVVIGMGYGQDDQSSIIGSVKKFFSTMSRASFQWGTYSPGVKLPLDEADHSTI
jgi:hypothetical protein